MNADLIYELIEIAISLAHSQGNETVQGEAEVAQTLADIVRQAVRAYEDHTGQPVNLDLIPSELGI
jgi:hypothetical protein